MNLKLLQLREEKNLSQDEVASILNVTRQAYSRYERGERELGYVALTQLAKFFDVSIDYLLGNSEYFYPDNIQNKELSHDEVVESDMEFKMNRFKELRKEKNITQVELAQHFKIDQTTVSKWELGKALPDTTLLIKLAKFFDVSIDYLLGSSEYFYPDTIQLSSSENFAKRSTDNTYSSIEKELIEEFRKLPESSKQLVLRMVGINAAEQTKKKKA